MLITTMTPTGSDRIRILYGPQLVHVYAPYDLPGVVRRFIGRMRPGLALIMETEIWPNLFQACHRQGTPVFMVNARMSEQSFRGYRRFATLVAETLGSLTGIMVQGTEDRRRFLALGAANDRLRTHGS